MIPIQPKPEPEDFHKRVRKPGMAFLDKVPKPTSKEWNANDYWRRSSKKLRTAYGGVCAYSCLWIPPVVGAGTVEHFEPKSMFPRLAYEWSNYRYVVARYNSRKGTKSILDPFKDVKEDWFVMRFPSLDIEPNPDLAPAESEAVADTINILKLNEDDEYKEYCMRWLLAYCEGDMTFKLLSEFAPFMGYELKRQGLKDDICEIMSHRFMEYEGDHDA